jgi:hypothetical protein
VSTLRIVEALDVVKHISSRLALSPCSKPRLFERGEETLPCRIVPDVWVSDRTLRFSDSLFTARTCLPWLRGRGRLTRTRSALPIEMSLWIADYLLPLSPGGIHAFKVDFKSLAENVDVKQVASRLGIGWSSQGSAVVLCSVRNPDGSISDFVGVLGEDIKGPSHG